MIHLKSIVSLSKLEQLYTNVTLGHMVADKGIRNNQDTIFVLVKDIGSRNMYYYHYLKNNSFKNE